MKESLRCIISISSCFFSWRPHGRSRPASLREPTSNPYTVSSLKVLDASCRTITDIVDLTRTLTFSPFLEKLSLSLSHLPPETKGREGLLSYLLSQLPNTLRSLAIDEVNESLLGHLTELIDGDAFPALEELYLYSMRIHGIEDADRFCNALKKGVSAKLKKLHLQVSDPALRNRWRFVSRMLGLGTESVTFPKLETLILGRFEDWQLLGEILLDGGFPCLERVVRRNNYRCGSEIVKGGREASRNNWYDFSRGTTQLWFKVLRLRTIAWGSPIQYSHDFDSTSSLAPLDMAKELLAGLREPLPVKVLSHIEVLSFENPPLNDEMCQGLADAITSGNLVCLKSLTFLFDGACSLESFRTLGKVINCDYLPWLTSLGLGIDSKEEVAPPHVHRWEAFFEAIPANGLSQIESIDFGGYSEFRGSVGPLFHAIAELRIKCPVAFTRLSKVLLYGTVSPDDLNHVSRVLSLGAFASLRSFTFYGKTSRIAFF